ncbi:MAG: hypothetical protein SGILL_007509, partial [Bacillariaceae sp.]
MGIACSKNSSAVEGVDVERNNNARVIQVVPSSLGALAGMQFGFVPLNNVTQNESNSNTPVFQAERRISNNNNDDDDNNNDDDNGVVQVCLDGGDDVVLTGSNTGMESFQADE